MPRRGYQFVENISAHIAVHSELSKIYYSGEVYFARFLDSLWNIRERQPRIC